MLADATLGDGWTVWNAEPDRAVLAYRPDVFDGSAFPSPCLPTVYAARGRPHRRPEGDRQLQPDAPWTVTLRLEPDVERDPDTYDSKADAVAGAERLTRRFSGGEVDYRALYRHAHSRGSYLDRLDELTGRG
jgi:hypothetical protein